MAELIALSTDEAARIFESEPEDLAVPQVYRVGRVYVGERRIIEDWRKSQHTSGADDATK